MPVFFHGLFALFASASLVGVAFMGFQVAAQNATGELGDATARVHNFSSAGARILDFRIAGPAHQWIHDRPRRARQRRSPSSRRSRWFPRAVVAAGKLTLPVLIPSAREW